MFHDDETDGPFEGSIGDAGRELGLIDPAPPSDDSYDYMLILGGLASGVEPRVAYAAQLLKQGLVIREQIAGLGSYRQLQERELPISRRYAPAARYEVDHLAAMMVSLLAPEHQVAEPQESTEPQSTAMVHSLAAPCPSHPEYVVYAAVGNDPSNRPANTIETYQVFLDAIENPIGQVALLVTSAIYVPYQHMDAVALLASAGMEVETIGLIVNDRSRHPNSAYLQEVRSALRSAERLIDAPSGGI
jgi:hypothetical protein